MKQSPFLTATWHDLLLVSYAVPDDLLKPYLAQGVEIHRWDGQAVVSLVAFDFGNTRLKGFRVPFHQRFPEVNLRYYARRDNHTGVGFIRELVPKPAISVVANLTYNEHYRMSPIRFVTQTEANQRLLSWQVRRAGRRHRIAARVENTPTWPQETLTDWLKERNWGFGKRRNGQAIQYNVQHPRWKIYPLRSYTLDLDYSKMFGPPWAILNAQKPISAFVAVGSEVVVQPWEAANAPILPTAPGSGSTGRAPFGAG